MSTLRTTNDVDARDPVATAGPTRTSARIYTGIALVAAVAILLQGLWAGIFLQHDGERDAAESWVQVHARGGDVAILLTLVALAFALWRLRERRELWVGGLALTVLLFVESYLGGLIVDESKDNLTVVHLPLAMAIMALAVWLPMRAWHHRND